MAMREKVGSARSASAGVRVCMANGGNLQRGPQLPFKSEYAQRNGVGCGRRQRLGEKVNARLSQVA